VLYIVAIIKRLSFIFAAALEYQLKETKVVSCFKIG